MTVWGICSPICDPTTGAIPGPTFLDALDALSPRAPLAVRAGISADANDQVNETAIRAGIDAYQARRHPVYVTLEQGLSRYHQLPANAGTADLAPNAILGTGMNGQPDTLLNPFIDRWTLTACAVLNRIGPVGIAGLFIDNETNLAGVALQPGQAPPASAPAALSAPVYGAMLYQAAERLHALVPWTRQIPIFPAPFSALVAFYRDQAGQDQYFGNYWHQMIATLRSAGKGPPFGFSGVATNCEGVITKTFGNPHAAYADFLFAYMTRLKTALQIEGVSVVGEYGVTNIGMQPAVMAAIHHKVGQYAALAFLYQFPLIYPGNATDYGLMDWGEDSGLFVPTARAPLYDVMQQIYGGG